MFRWYWTISPQALAGTIYFCGEEVTRSEDQVAAEELERERTLFASAYGRAANLLEERWSTGPYRVGRRGPGGRS